MPTRSLPAPANVGSATGLAPAATISVKARMTSSVLNAITAMPSPCLAKYSVRTASPTAGVVSSSLIWPWRNSTECRPLPAGDLPATAKP